MENFLRKARERIQRKLEETKTGSKYFAQTRRGEAAELQNDLNGTDSYRKKAAVKRIIANMTMGRDVSYLFVDVVKLAPSTDLELKKLVYLYVLSTARLQPEKALLAVNTFLQDTTNSSPVVRALAVRTMMCIRVSSVLEYTLEPLRRAVADPDPYVRKTAAMGLGKLFHDDMNLFYQQDFKKDLVELLNDNNPIVASNAAAIVCEVNDYGSEKIESSNEWVNRLVYHLPECNEWGQQYILDLLAAQRPSDKESAETLLTRVLPRMNHQNPAVVMGAIKVVANLASRCSQELIERCTVRVNTALLTLAKRDAETQYIVCKNIHALLVIFPNLLRTNLDAFYVRYSDPPFVKLEKLRLLLKLATPSVAPEIAKELAEYASGVDMVFVVEVVRAIASLAIKVDSMAPDCANLLMQLVDRRPELLPHVVTAAKDIVRKYPELLMLDALVTDYGADEVVEEEAKVSLLWMLGEYCDFIENGKDIIQRFIDTIMEHEQRVQLAILSAAVKMFLRDPQTMEPQLNRVLETVTTHSDDADVRDRAFAYWRLLSKGITVEQMKKVVHGQMVPVNVDHTFSDAMTMADLKKSLNTAAIVFARPYQSFLPPYGLADVELDEEDTEDDDAVKLPATPSMGTQDGASAPDAARARYDIFEFLGDGTGARHPVASGSNGAQHADPFGDLFSASPSTVGASSPAFQAASGSQAPASPPTAASAMEDLFGNGMGSGSQTVPAPISAAPQSAGRDTQLNDLFS
ncbi:putative beta-adaptin [Leishmania infantum JPCM5]|uniref:AP complex subunit beta n=2 Tax=Leishmania infantum TaxID=5671 RepID=A0A6L0XUL8_LEIIN|nr:putative beta-adaptin [Leishmania infantum JPCM5]CAC9553445.1 adaptin_complex_1_subunit_-_putative [Leishmania infantum]CAM72493.1 putative beta-adaptin [Leishmania infantum JPCM5]SUZ47099.1 adaptin_complex_1_subunit_-_putative [Leishmania infantum]|eukprot:XP_001469386.1 putative beta-adaptin [Leishmania infantum JPCM5]